MVFVVVVVEVLVGEGVLVRADMVWTLIVG